MDRDELPVLLAFRKNTDYVNVDLLTPRPGDYGRLDVRRLVDVVAVHRCLTMKLAE